MDPDARNWNMQTQDDIRNEFEAKVKSGRPLISPIDCKHHRTRLIRETFGPGPYRDYVSVCANCGRFLVTATKGTEHFRIEFELSTPESVEAAGRYLQYLESEGD